MLSLSQYSFTTCASIGTYLGALLTTLPATELVQLRQVRIEGDRATLNEAVALYEQSHPGVKIDVTYQSVEDAKVELSTLSGFDWFRAWLLLDWAQGQSDLTRGGTVKLDNGLVPGWKPETVKGYLARM